MSRTRPFHAGRLNRVCRMILQGNFAGLWHRLKCRAGLRGPVPVSAALEPAALLELRGGIPAVRTAADRVPKILFFSHDLNREGAALSLFEIVKGFQSRGLAGTEVISSEDGPLRLDYERARLSVSAASIYPEDLSTPARLERMETRLAEEILARRPDLVFANTLRSFPAVLAAARVRVPSIWNVRESASWQEFFRYLPDPVAQQAASAVCLPYRVVFVSSASRTVWKDFDVCGNFETIHNGIDVSRFRRCRTDEERARKGLAVSEDESVLLNVGTINARKGQADLLEAAALLRPEVLKRIRILFVGDGSDPYAAKLRRRHGTLLPEIKERIRFFPETAAVENFYRAAGVFVLCSREESYPRVLLEAMASGLPIITTPVFGVREQVREGENAFFYEPGNAGELALAIERLVCDETLRRRMSEASLARSAVLPSFEGMLESYAALCRGTVRISHPGPA